MSSAGDSPLVIVLTTLDDGMDATAFARTLVEERLAACVSIVPGLTSIYRWKHTIEQAREQQLLIKTTAARLADLQTRFKTAHPYEVPEFIVLSPADVADTYLQWVRTSVDASEQ